jgi:hypothetical protein
LLCCSWTVNNWWEQKKGQPRSIRKQPLFTYFVIFAPSVGDTLVAAVQCHSCGQIKRNRKPEISKPNPRGKFFEERLGTNFSVCAKNCLKNWPAVPN